ncbi:hypothetical protein COL922a_009813 [Colletotrichum nupharicola]|nr:hypothetical protein COL922a_009813 [Colletotrichum nupharicola]
MGTEPDKARKEESPPPHGRATILEVHGIDDAAIIPKGALDPVYEAKARVLNRAIQDIGMGWYQWQLFVVVGFGWASDNLWPIVTSLIFTPIANEFKPTRPPLLSLSQNIGLLAGAMFWGFGCDIFGRKIAFNLTLGLTAVWGMIAAGAPNFAAIGIFAAFWSFGVGGNLPVDSAIFLEFLPGTHQYLLTVLSIDWAIAQVIATLIAWPLLGNLTCQQGQTCTKSNNMGWRYFIVTIGGLTLVMFLVRFALFTIYESPKYLMGKGRDEDAVRIVHEVARRNGKITSLSVEDLKACEPEGYVARTDATAAVKRNLEKLDLSHVRVLFSTPRLALSTGLIMAVWALIGLGYPLYNAFIPYIQATRGAEIGDGSTNALLGWNCAFNLSSNVMYAVLYGFTPELFPTPQRGTGNALTATCNRIFGIMAPIVAMFANLKTSAPVYTSGALFIAAGLLVLFMPFESRGKAAL